MSGMRRVFAWMLSLALVLSLALQVSICARAAEEPTGNTSAEQATQAPTEKATEKPTQAPTEPATEKPTQAPTEPATEKPTQAPTEPATEKPSEAPTQQATEKPTEQPTQAPAEATPDSPSEQPTGKAKPTEKPTEKAAKAAVTETLTEVVTESVTVRKDALGAPAEGHHASYNPWTNGTALPTTEGTYVLNQDVTLSDTWSAPTGATTLCLNGHKITKASSANCTLIHVNTGATLTLEDCKGTGKLTGGKASSWVIRDGESASPTGGAVYISGGTLKLDSVTVTGNTSDLTGGGIMVNGGALEITGKSDLTGNTAHQDSMGADLYAYAGTVKLSGTGKLSKVRLNTGATLTVEPGFAPDGTITVWTEAQENGKSYFITTGFTTALGESAKVTDYFASGDSNFHVHKASGEAVLHAKGFTYTLSSDKTALTASCAGGSGCTTAPDVTLTLDAPGGNYTGSAFTATLNRLDDFNAATGLAVSEDDITYTDQEGNTVSGAPINAGTYTASLELDGKTLKKTFTINKASIPEADITAPTGKTLTYTGEKQALYDKGSANGGTMVYSASETGTYAESVMVGRKAGRYTLWYKVLGDDNHLDTAPQSFVVRMEKAEATITAMDQTVVTGGVNFADGTKGVTITGLVSDKQTLSKVTLTHSDFTTETTKGTIKPADAVIVEGSEDTTKNYNLTYQDGKLTVIPRIVKQVEGTGVADLAFTLTDKSVENLVKTLGVQDAYNEGNQVVLTLKVKVLKEDKVSSEEKTLITKAMGNGGKAAQYMDLTLTLTMAGKTHQLKDLGNEKVTLTMTVPKSAQSAKTTRNYYLVSVHDGKATLLAKDTKTTLSGKSSLFSTYALGYNDGSSSSKSGTSSSSKSGTSSGSKSNTVNSTSSSNKSTNPKTGDSANTDTWVSLCAGAGLCLWALAVAEWKEHRKKDE